MKKITKIRLFLSSPGDVKNERKRVSSVVAQVNRMLGDSLDFLIVKSSIGKPMSYRIWDGPRR